MALALALDLLPGNENHDRPSGLTNQKCNEGTFIQQMEKWDHGKRKPECFSLSKYTRVCSFLVWPLHIADWGARFGGDFIEGIINHLHRPPL